MNHEPAKKRSSAFVRPSSPLPFRWTPRDALLLARVWEDKILSTSQLSTIWFKRSTGSPRKRCAKRLRTLYSHHLLDRHWLPLLPAYRGRTDAFYTIGKRAVAVVAQKLALPLEYIRRTRQKFSQQLKSYSILLTLSHLQTLNQVRLAFETALTQNDSTELLRWIPERLLEQRFQTNDDHLKLRPDGFVVYRQTKTDKTYSGFIEVDLGTESSKQIMNKVRRYLAFSETEIPLESFGSRWFRVIFISPSQRRSLELKNAIENLTDKLFWITEQDQLTGGWVNQPLFLRAGLEGRHPLID